MQEIVVNNEKREVEAKTTLQQLLTNLSIAPDGIAVAVNEEVISKTQWSAYLLQPQDEVMVIRATQGG